MAPTDPLTLAAEELGFLLEEFHYSSGWLVENLKPLMDGLIGGRSPRALNLEISLEGPEGLLNSLKEIHQEVIKKAKSLGPGELSKNIQGEIHLWEEFLQIASGLMQKLKLMATQSQITTLGKMPLEDAWQEIKRLAGLN